MMGNDVTIIGGIIFTMLIVAFLIPFIQDEFGETVTENTIDTVILEENIEDMGIWDLKDSLFSMFIFTYSFFPLWLKILHWAIRIILLLLILRQIRSGAG